MAVSLFDVQAAILGYGPGEREFLQPEELLDTMGELGISRALVRRWPETGGTSDPIRSNEILYRACGDNDALLPCPVVVPNTGYDLADEEDQVAEAISHGAGAVCIRPAHHHWFIVDWISDRLFNALSERRMPLYVAEDMVSTMETAKLAGGFSGVPIIFAEAGYSDQRTLLPMLERFPNVYLSMGNNYIVHKGIEQIAEKTGVDRLMFGTNFPASEPMAAVTQLMYAGITDEQKQQIGSGNMERLMAGIKK